MSNYRNRAGQYICAGIFLIVAIWLVSSVDFSAGPVDFSNDPNIQYVQMIAPFAYILGIIFLIVGIYYGIRHLSSE
ncbi:MAG: hypothetical protein ACFFDP_04430 [Promethearchaeota archaeon]